MMKKANPVWESFEKVDDMQVKCKLALTLSTFAVELQSSMLSQLRDKHPCITQTMPLSSLSAGTVASQPKTTHGQQIQPTMASFVTL